MSQNNKAFIAFMDLKGRLLSFGGRDIPVDMEAIKYIDPLALWEYRVATYIRHQYGGNSTQIFKVPTMPGDKRGAIFLALFMGELRHSLEWSYGTMVLWEKVIDASIQSFLYQYCQESIDKFLQMVEVGPLWMIYSQEVNIAGWSGTISVSVSADARYFLMRNTVESSYHDNGIIHSTTNNPAEALKYINLVKSGAVAQYDTFADQPDRSTSKVIHLIRNPSTPDIMNAILTQYGLVRVDDKNIINEALESLSTKLNREDK